MSPGQINQRVSICETGTVTITLSDGTEHFYGARQPVICRISSVKEVNSLLMTTGAPFKISGPRDKDGLWHVLILEPSEYGQSTEVIAQLSREEATDLHEKMRRAGKRV